MNTETIIMPGKIVRLIEAQAARDESLIELRRKILIEKSRCKIMLAQIELEWLQAPGLHQHGDENWPRK